MTMGLMPYYLLVWVLQRIQNPERKNTLFGLYLAGFVILGLVLYFCSADERWLCLGILSSIAVLLVPVGAFVFGYITRDPFRAFLAGALSYASLVTIIVIVSGLDRFQGGSAYLYQFVGYHAALVVLAGLVGLCAARRTVSFYLTGIALCIAWLWLFFTGIS